EGRPPGPPIPP
nr:bradykinin potentiating peptide [Gloydius halys]prf//1005285A bradykinin potentiating peptide [Gloydius halys]prf//1208380A bradykinin potentiating peptide [Gloydius halys]